jgi:hypothetical protein
MLQFSAQLPVMTLAVFDVDEISGIVLFSSSSVLPPFVSIFLPKLPTKTCSAHSIQIAS